MIVQKKIKKSSLIFLMIVSAIIGVGLPILANTPKGKELYADAWLDFIMPFIMFGAYLLIVVSTWKSKNNQQKFLWSGLLILITLFALYQTSDNWQYMPWGHASAFKTANSFLVSMNQSDYEGATQYMKPCVREEVGTRVLGNVGQTKPVSWQFTDYKREYAYVSIIGLAKLINGSDVRTEIKMQWNGFKWEIYSVIFGEPYKDAIIQFLWGC